MPASEELLRLRAEARQDRLEADAERARKRADGQGPTGWCRGGIGTGSTGAHWTNRQACPTCGKIVQMHKLSGKTYRHKPAKNSPT